MPVEHDRHEVPDEVWGVLWCPACSSRSFVVEDITGAYCKDCSADIAIMGSYKGTVRVAFRDAKPYQVEDRQAQEIVGTVIAQVDEMDGSWKFTEWQGTGNNDWEPLPPLPKPVEEVRGFEPNPETKRRMVN